MVTKYTQAKLPKLQEVKQESLKRYEASELGRVSTPKDKLNEWQDQMVSPSFDQQTTDLRIRKARERLRRITKKKALASGPPQFPKYDMFAWREPLEVDPNWRESDSDSVGNSKGDSDGNSGSDSRKL